MPPRLRVGFSGMTHDHVWEIARQWSELQVELVAAADPNEPLRARMLERVGVKRAYPDYQAMLGKEQLDIVTVCLDNAHHAEAVEAAVEAGAHCLVEKPMAATLAQAERMLLAAERHNRLLMINWPTTWMPIYRLAAELAARGDLGRVFQVKHRGGHWGPKAIGCSEYFQGWLYNRDLNGAGAYMDYSGYGTNLVYEYLGMPASVYAYAANLVQDFHPVDDNAVLMLRYPRAVGLVESSWTAAGHLPGNTVISGESATLLADYRAGSLVRFDANNREGKALKPPPLPPGHKNGPEYFLGRVQRNELVDGPSEPRRCRDVQEVLEAGLLSMAERRDIDLPLRR